MSPAGRWWAGTIAWVLLVLASMLLIGYGLAWSLFFIWAPEPPMLEKAGVGARYIFTGTALSIVAAAWSHLRGHPAWVGICAALPGILVGWADSVSPYSFLRILAAVVAFPLAVSGVAEVIWAGGRRQRT